MWILFEWGFNGVFVVLRVLDVLELILLVWILLLGCWIILLGIGERFDFVRDVEFEDDIFLIMGDLNNIGVFFVCEILNE